ncbi:vacuolar protein 8-like [Zingiber officinale]|uniref:DUF7032 domain-containing protein n=1 Tax=Zingiber officinale TaxID=94328 RepID=A0A8J5F0Y9_ZINOF|nr:vacuolar protein 8-like [Zingiber officinale]KAG6478896.1 hypothetical protein ZIOFF_062342 [Zingiber officinale]
MTSDMVQEEVEESATVLEQPQEISLRRDLVDLVNLLISSTYILRCFQSKWQLIRLKLEQLSSSLAAADHSSNSSRILDLLQSVAATVGEAQGLVVRCADESYSGGKLLLRSDLDVVAAKLDLHLKRLEEVYASGILTIGRAIVLSRPDAGASREDIRFYVKDLVSRLKIGDVEMRLRALSALNEALREDDRYARILSVEVADGVASLVTLLEYCGRGDMQEEAAEAVAAVARFDSHKSALVMAGAVAPLIRLLETSGIRMVAKERAASALKMLTENSDNAWSVSAHGGVPALLSICSDDSSTSELVRSACGVLRSISGVEEIKRYMVEQGAVAAFIKLAGASDEVAQVQGIELLLAVSCHGEQSTSARDGMLGALVRVLDAGSPKAKEVALRAIENLCITSPSVAVADHLVVSGFLDRALILLRGGEVSVQEAALKAVSRLGSASEAVKRAMGDAGFIPELVRLLEARSFQVREMAAEALAGVLSVHKNGKRFVKEEENLNRLLRLLNPEEKSATKRFLVAALVTLTDHGTTVRRRIAASGCVEHLEKLAETDVAEAKKLIKKLSSANRFTAIFAGIWSS